MNNKHVYNLFKDYHMAIYTSNVVHPSLLLHCLIALNLVTAYDTPLCPGPALYGLAAAGAMGHTNVGFVPCLLFASFIVAVDPVAVSSR